MRIESQNIAFLVTSDEVVVETRDATPMTILSFPIGDEKVVYAEALVMAYDGAAMNPGGIVKAEAIFLRRSTGALQRVQAPKITIVLANFVPPQPTLDLVASAGATVDLVITGKVEWLRWHARLTVTQTS